jgi:hypothetical protein
MAISSDSPHALWGLSTLHKDDTATVVSPTVSGAILHAFNTVPVLPDFFPGPVVSLVPLWVTHKRLSLTSQLIQFTDQLELS